MVGGGGVEEGAERWWVVVWEGMERGGKERTINFSSVQYTIILRPRLIEGALDVL